MCKKNKNFDINKYIKKYIKYFILSLNSTVKFKKKIYDNNFIENILDVDTVNTFTINF